MDGIFDTSNRTWKYEKCMSGNYFKTFDSWEILLGSREENIISMAAWNGIGRNLLNYFISNQVLK